VPTSVRSCSGWGRACLRAIVTSWRHVTSILNRQQALLFQFFSGTARFAVC
jgi:hypothetical protein